MVEFYPLGVESEDMERNATLSTVLQVLTLLVSLVGAVGVLIVVGLSQSAWSIPDLAVELSALEHVRDETPDLQGDRVARSEVLGRIAALQGQLEI